MAARRRTAPTSIDSRSGGVYIDGKSQVDVGGDLVGRDKIAVGDETQSIEALFTRLKHVIETSEMLDQGEKRALSDQAGELKAELTQPAPDLGKIASLKQFLLAKGDRIAAAVGAIFQYPPVQEAIKAASQTLTQRLLGG